MNFSGGSESECKVREEIPNGFVTLREEKKISKGRLTPIYVYEDLLSCSMSVIDANIGIWYFAEYLA